MNNCSFNHPRPIFCPYVNLDCTGNTVVNPVLPANFAFFANPSPGTISAGANIPLTISNSSGNNFVPNGFGGITLTAGTYEITYLVSAVVPASGSVTMGLTIGGEDVANSNVTSSQSSGDQVNLNRTLVLNVPQTSSLYIANLGDSAVAFNFASLFVRAL